MFRSSPTAALFLLLLCLSSFFAGLGLRELWNPVEPRYAGICAEMLRGESWLVPTYNGRPYAQKPALFFWLGGNALRAGEDGETRRFLVRLPSAIGALLLVFGTAAFGARLWSRDVGLIAGMLTASSWLPFWSGRFCHIDTLAAASVVFGLLGAWSAADATGGRRALRVLATGVVLGVGLLLKGPGPLLFAVMTLSLFSAWRRDLGFLRRCGLFPALLVALGLGAAWFLPAWSAAGNAWAHELAVESGLLHHFESSRDKHRWFYYPMVVWGLAAPWSLAAPAAVLFAVRRRRDDGDRDGVVLCLAWLIVVVALLYSGTTYRGRYLLPALPPLFLLVARWFDASIRAASAGRTAGFVAGFAATAMLVLAGLLVAAPYLTSEGGVFDVLREVGASRGLRFGLAGALALSAAASLAALRRDLGAAVRRAALAVSVGFAAWGLLGAPAVDVIRNDREVVARLRPLLESGRRLVAVRSYADRESTFGLYGFNLGVPLGVSDFEGDDLRRLLDREPLVVLARPRDLAVYPRCIPEGWRRVNPEPLGRHEVDLWINPWPPEGR